MRGRNGVDLEDAEELGEQIEGRNVNQGILCEKNLFSIQRKKM